MVVVVAAAAVAWGEGRPCSPAEVGASSDLILFVPGAGGASQVNKHISDARAAAPPPPSTPSALDKPLTTAHEKTNQALHKARRRFWLVGWLVGRAARRVECWRTERNEKELALAVGRARQTGGASHDISELLPSTLFKPGGGAPRWIAHP